MRQYERVSVSGCWEEIDPILKQEHWPEVGHYKDIPIDMDWKRYFAIEEKGFLRCFVAMSPTNEEFNRRELLGYAFYVVDNHLHYQQTKMAHQDILYIRKQHRGFGRDFISWCDRQLAAEGVVTVVQHLKPWFDWSPMLEELGYEFAEKIYTRRLR